MRLSRRAWLGGLAALGAGLFVPPAGARRKNVTNALGVGVSTIQYAGVDVDLVCVDLTRARLSLHWQRPDGARFGSLRAVDDWLRRAGEQPLALTNAGIFATDAPVGVHIEDGQLRHPLVRGGGDGNFSLLPNGVFLVGKAGARVVETSHFDARDVQLATQSGPLLLAGGVLHPRFIHASHNALIRSGVGVYARDTVWLAVTRGPITFWDFACLFRDRLGCADALYLDGTISRLYAPSLNRYDDGQFMGILAVCAGR